MKHYYDQWRNRILDALVTFADGSTDGSTDKSALRAALLAETPPDSTMGDIAFPMFPFARILRKSPNDIAAGVCAAVSAGSTDAGSKVEPAGPYVNVFLNRADISGTVLASVLKEQETFGRTGGMTGRSVMVEFSAPNTNKPLHLGHLRNDALGESISRLLAAAGATVQKVNLINDRGIHICKSMLAYRKFGEGATPESLGKKTDHFVGDFYVRYSQWEKEDPTAEQQARDMLQSWEAGEPETVDLWNRMNTWAIEGVQKTYQRTGITFDRVYRESDTYTLGRDEILKGIETGVFYRDEKGTVWVDLADIGLDKKVLLRADGTSVYLTQDIGTAIERHREWPFDQLIFIVANEQRYHFQVLFEVLKRLGMEWAANLHHLSYGMVNLPEGKMKSREGTVVDADVLIDELAGMAEREIRAKGRESSVGGVEETAEKVALAALHYYLLQTNPNKDMIFDPAESLSFTGNTGPYLQYVGARIASMIRKAGDAPKSAEPQSKGYSTPTVLEEWDLIKKIAFFPFVCADAADGLNPSLVANALYDIAKTFSRFYHDHPIAIADDPDVRAFRLSLSHAVSIVMENGLRLLNIPYLEAM